MAFSFKSAAWKVVKAGAIMFTVGALLAVAAPLIAQALGPELLGEAAFAQAMNTSVAWTAAFFGAFGAIHAAVEPVENALFNKTETVAKKTAARLRSPVIAKQPAPTLPEPDIESTYHRDLLAKEQQAAAQTMRGA